ncbi:CsbD family protein [Sulfurifustis variabilis]|uniref:CsbD family protein n=1 Tax=Sulfurifustis variabilis TaxID=1675686 RepID=UPI0018D5A71F|nr:CsbD family protein [Sulfurifustis variabilis]
MASFRSWVIPHEVRRPEAVINTHQLKGRISQASGKVKEITGRLFGKKALEEKGRAEKTGGRIQAGYGDVKDDIKRH